MSTQAYQSTTQVFLDIYDITNDLLLMKDGTASVIITVDAMNFGLLAEEEQDAVMYAYAGLLNSLNYPIQIVIRSQTKDVTSYLQKLKEQEDLADTRLNQTRIGRYREFVSNLIRERNVLDKKFYVVIPATSIELGILPTSDVIPGKQKFDMSSVEKSVILEKARSILEPKRDHIIGQFGRIGLYSRQLNTQEIIQLFYLSYNPEAADGQQLTDSRNYTTPMVSASIDQVAVENFNSAKQAPLNNVPVQPVEPTPPVVTPTPTPTEPVVTSDIDQNPPLQEPVQTTTDTIQNHSEPIVNTPPLDEYKPPAPTSTVDQTTPADQGTTLESTPVEPTPLVESPSPVVTPMSPSTPPATTATQTPPLSTAQPKHFFIPPAKQPPASSQQTVFETKKTIPNTTPTLQNTSPTQAEFASPPNVATIEPVNSPPSVATPQPTNNTIFNSNNSTSENKPVEQVETTSDSTVTPPSTNSTLELETTQKPQTVVASEPVVPADAQAEIDALANNIAPLTKPDEPLPPLPEIT